MLTGVPQRSVSALALTHAVDHLAFHVRDRDALEHWVAHLDEAGVAHSGIVDVGGWGWMIELRDPDGIQLELFARS
ncbi:MAG: VOC family protein [Actinobacteria bacterium]|nr:VOC family protein [Actinomycetota bacterium]